MYEKNFRLLETVFINIRRMKQGDVFKIHFVKVFKAVELRFSK